MATMAMLNDVSKCMACRACQVACKGWNDLPAETTRNWGTYENPPRLSAHTWTRVQFRETAASAVEWAFLKGQCMHCTDAPCVAVCPTGAMRKVDNNFVVVDQDWCIGCRYCVQSCPYQVPALDPATGTVKKCTFCVDRVTNGLRPACAKACPTGAISFGTREEMMAQAQQRVAFLQGNGFSEAQVYGDRQLSGLNVIYVLTHPPAFYGLPEDPAQPSVTLLSDWLSGLGAGAILGVVPFWWILKRRTEMAIQEGGE
ncbi:MAG: 4Fe-4S dicluster domain-containing protein [Anaerolineae bacterium]